MEEGEEEEEQEEGEGEGEGGEGEGDLYSSHSEDIWSKQAIHILNKDNISLNFHQN